MTCDDWIDFADPNEKKILKKYSPHRQIFFMTKKWGAFTIILRSLFDTPCANEKREREKKQWKRKKNSIMQSSFSYWHRNDLVHWLKFVYALGNSKPPTHSNIIDFEERRRARNSLGQKIDISLYINIFIYSVQCSKRRKKIRKVMKKKRSDERRLLQIRWANHQLR